LSYVIGRKFAGNCDSTGFRSAILHGDRDVIPAREHRPLLAGLGRPPALPGSSFGWARVASGDAGPALRRDGGFGGQRNVGGRRPVRPPLAVWFGQREDVAAIDRAAARALHRDQIVAAGDLEP